MQTQSSILIKAFTLANTKPQVDQSNIIHEPFPSIRKNLEWLDTLIQAFLVYSKFLLLVQGYKTWHSYSKNKCWKKGKKLKVYFISMKCHLTIAIQMANDTMILTTLNPCTLEHHWCSNQRSCKYFEMAHVIRPSCPSTTWRSSSSSFDGCKTWLQRKILTNFSKSSPNGSLY